MNAVDAHKKSWPSGKKWDFCVHCVSEPVGVDMQRDVFVLNVVNWVTYDLPGRTLRCFWTKFKVMATRTSVCAEEGGGV